MRDIDCVEFLQWALPRMGFRWPGFRKVRRQVCKRIDRRLAELGLDGVCAYRELLDDRPREWSRLDDMCRITISRFHRDRGVFEALGDEVLPVLAREARTEERALRVWSAGCGSGEEPYSVAIVWELGLASDYPAVELSVLATDAGETVLERALAARYPASSLKELPEAWRERAFVRRGDLWELLPPFRTAVRFERADIRESMPERRFDLVLCRNLAFTYFDRAVQERCLAGLIDRLRPGGGLVIGSHEELPRPHPELEPWNDLPHLFRRREIDTETDP